MPDRNTRHVAYWLERSQCVAVKLAKITGGSSSSFVDVICQQYLTSKDKDVIYDSIIRTSRLTTSIRRYHHEVLQLAGVGTDLQVVTAVEDDVREVTGWLEELLCTAMVNHQDVVDTYNARGFGFQ